VSYNAAKRIFPAAKEIVTAKSNKSKKFRCNPRFFFLPFFASSPLPVFDFAVILFFHAAAKRKAPGAAAGW
jgi:hypothetical protein